MDCSFCPYACFIESKMEKLFRCQRPECRKVSCRQCKLVRLGSQTVLRH